MENTAVIALAGLCLGIAFTGLVAVVAARGKGRERQSLGCVYAAFIVMIALPLVGIFASTAFTFYLPLVLVMLLCLPPAFYHYVLAKTATVHHGRVPWWHLVLPMAGMVVCIGFWLLSSEAKTTLFIDGELPAGILPSTLALVTFLLILLWPVASFAYLVVILRRLAAYRVHIRNHYSDVEKRDLRWVELVMVLFALMWAVGAMLLIDENLAQGRLLIEEVLFALTACCLLSLNLFAANAPELAEPAPTEEEQSFKYARSALTEEHAAKLAGRINAAMRNDALFLDPTLSLQKLSRHVGAVPNQISQTLNQEIGMAFFDYVAHWRIEASKPLIMAGDASVLTIALEVGFNARSTFYNAFKREVGMTPKEYRMSQVASGNESQS